MPMPLVQTLANGAKLYIINKGDQEVCRIDILFEGGRYAASTPAIADITGPMLRKGIPGMDQEAIAEHLDYHGAWLQSGTTQHYSTLSLFSLNRNLEKVLPTMAAMITSPNHAAKHVLRSQGRHCVHKPIRFLPFHQPRLNQNPWQRDEHRYGGILRLFQPQFSQDSKQCRKHRKLRFH